jgi:uncharacterized paraquat-inducible protein A
MCWALNFLGNHMKCPNCGVKVNLLKAMKVSKWSNYVCPTCNKEATRPPVNAGTVAGLAVALFFGLRLVFSSIGMSNIAVEIALGVTCYLLLEVTLGKLESAEKT